MKISTEMINGLQQIKPLESTTRAQKSDAAGLSDFSKGLTQALDSLAATQAQADSAIAGASVGQTSDLQQVVLAVEKANMAIQMSVQVRNKVVDAYQEIMRMQV